MHGTEGPDFFVPISNETGLVQSPFEYPQYYLAEPWVFNMLAAYMLFLIVASLGLNVLTFKVTIKYQKLRTPLNYVLLNLATANIIGVIGGYTSTLHATLNGYFVYDHSGCNAEGFFTTLYRQVTLWSLVVLAMERWLVVCKPLKKFRFRVSHCCLGVGVSWMLAYSCALPPLLEWSRYIPEGLQCSCGVDFYTLKPDFYNESFVFYMFAVHFVTPLCIISFCFMCLLCMGKAESEEQQEGKAGQASQSEVTRMVIVMILGFLVCWLPYAYTAWYSFTNQGITMNPFFISVPSFFGRSSTLYSPIIYICMNKPFRDCVIGYIYNEEEEDIATRSHE